MFSTYNTGFIDNASGTNGNPDGFTHHHGFQVRHDNMSNQWGYQFIGSYHPTYPSLFHRSVNAGTWNSWKEIWDSGNDGSGSGLDADLLDGQQGSYYAPASHAHSYLPLTGGSLSGTLAFSQPVGLSFANGQYIKDNGGGGLVIYSGAAINLNHTSLTSNGGTVWASNNDGSGSGLDADLLDSLELHTGRNNEANKVVRTDVNGYIQAGWINTTSGAYTTEVPNRFYASNDAYVRYYSRTWMQNHLGLSGKTSFVPRSASSTSEYYRTGSQGWASLNFNDMFNRGSCFIDLWGHTNGPTTGHSTGFQSLHYSASNTYHHGMQMVMQDGNPSATYLRGWWANGGSGYAWQKIWTDGNDGSGSGLDADTVDGVQASGFSRLNSNNTAGTHHNLNDGKLYLRTYNDNNHYLWNNASDWEELVAYQGTGFKITSSLGYNMMTFSGTGAVSMAGSFTAGGNVTAYSDERLKTDIKTLDGKKVLQMRGVSFTKDGEAGSGVIAQELEKIAPELVHDGEYKSVAYGNLVGYLIENAKEQQKEIDELKLLVKQLLEK